MIQWLVVFHRVQQTVWPTELDYVREREILAERKGQVRTGLKFVQCACSSLHKINA